MACTATYLYLGPLRSIMFDFAHSSGCMVAVLLYIVASCYYSRIPRHTLYIYMYIYIHNENCFYTCIYAIVYIHVYLEW